MKKLITIILLFAAIGVKAQTNTGSFASDDYSNGIDTVTNTGSKTQTLSLAGYWDIFTIQCRVAKISGTVGGVIQLYGNISSNSYVLIATDTVTNTAGFKSYSFSVNPSIYSHYEVIYTGTGTMSAGFNTYWLARKAIVQKQQ